MQVHLVSDGGQSDRSSPWLFSISEWVLMGPTPFFVRKAGALETGFRLLSPSFHQDFSQ